MAEFDAELDLLRGGDEIDNLENVDENALLNERHTPVDLKREDEDLFDAAMAPPIEKSDPPTPTVTTPVAVTKAPTYTYTAPPANSSSYEGKKYVEERFCVYIGNLTWWTTDADLTQSVEAAGLNDLIDVKFFENRNNGQSKGYALLVFGSEQSVHLATERMSQRPIHGQSVALLPYTKQSLQRLEDATAKSAPRMDSGMKKKDDCLDMGTIRIGAGGPSGGGMMGTRPMQPQQQPPPQPLMQQPAPTLMMRPGPNGPQLTMAPMGGGAPPMGMGPPRPGQPQSLGQIVIGPPGVPVQQNPMMQGRPPMGQPNGMMLPPGVAPNMAPPGTGPMQMGGVRPGGVMGAPGVMQQPMLPHMQQMQGPPPGMQQRPGMMTQAPPGMAQQPMMNAPPPGMRQGPPPQMPPPGAHVNPNVFPMGAGGLPPMGGHGGGGPMSDGEFEEVMNRNRTVSSSAISRAVTDAAAGDIKSAIETLLTAISLIKQSRVAHDDRCRMLVANLQDTLQGIEHKASYGSSRKSHRDRDRSRSRSRDRDRKRSSRRRSRSRSDSRSRSRSPHHRSSRRY